MLAATRSSVNLARARLLERLQFQALSASLLRKTVTKVELRGAVDA